MCQLFTGARPQLYASRVRSIRLGGVATSIRLENIYWQALEEIGARDGLTVPRLVSRLHEELAAAGTLGDRANFTSFLRVSCTRYLQLQVAGLVPTDCSVPIRDLDSRSILAAERATAERTEKQALAA
ncbi:aryl-sulfate sulfotransferase [Azoarcus indigens]|uniref:Putative DNA-binding ribbon-helix-helix protein n=1 Tax=Azoarcus indigens TaxID=29545 RepID=A0A4R6EH23_9RHOO|nr:ribbon-helix-helix domain-containing protein [Azoarcus indigens]NMG65323.1 aryl-sulfate sulfotransferase [Azoarcus indigens]TDN56707.1 putative DNA-binding ribbon-helix-helix protein [Azoarcus indigens]